MANFRPLSRSEVGELCSLYGLDLVDFGLLAGGNTSTNHLLFTHQGEYVASVLESTDSAHNERLALIMRCLADAGIPVNEPLRSHVGTYIQSASGFDVLVTKRVIGRCSRQLPFDDLFEAGRTLGMIHKVDPPKWLARETRRVLDHELEEVEDDGFKSWVADKRRAFDEVAKKLPTGLIHGDYFGDNLIIDNNATMHVIDWVTASKDTLALDVGIALIGMSRVDAVPQPQRIAEFLRGYRVRRPIADDELRHLRECVLYGCAILAVRRYLSAQLHAEFSSELLDYRHMVQLASEFQAMDFDF